MPPRSDPKGPRPPLSKERVLQAAVEVADAAGIDSLTMRRLAQEVGIEAMSLYHYVSNKDDIIDGIVDRVVGEFELPGHGDDWKSSLRATAISAHVILVHHPWAAGPAPAAIDHEIECARHGSAR